MLSFWRAEVQKGKNKVNLQKFHGMPYTTLSSHCEETMKADSRAFAALMRHIREIDVEEHTVVLMQVENEPGLQGAAREHSDYADKLFNEKVPKEFADYMRSHTDEMSEDVRTAIENGAECGNWEEVFGTVAEEVFHTYSVARYIECVASAGKKEYDLPMMEVWRYCAPHIDILAPDIYVQDFCDVCDEYTKLGNPLVIPETAMHGHAGPRLVYVVGHYHAFGFSPFGFEDLGQPFTAVDSYLFGVDVSDPLLLTPQDAGEYAWYNRTLGDMMPLLTSKYGTKDLQAVISERPEQDTMIFDCYGFKVITDTPMITRKDGVCLILRVL